MLGSTGEWSDVTVGAAIDAEGGVPEACVLLLESAATAAAFQPDVKAGSQSVTQSHVADALRKAAQAIRDDYGLPGGAGTITTMQAWSGRDVLGCISDCGNGCIGPDCGCYCI